MAGALAGSLGGGGGASVSASSSASAGPQSGTTGSLILNFGGINLGSQDIPLTQSDNQATNQPATQGRTPLSALTAPFSGGASAGGSSGLLLYAVLGIGAVLLFYMLKHR
jgi:hypothetical protein